MVDLNLRVHVGRGGVVEGDLVPVHGEVSSSSISLVSEMTEHIRVEHSGLGYRRNVWYFCAHYGFLKSSHAVHSALEAALTEDGVISHFNLCFKNVEGALIIHIYRSVLSSCRRRITIFLDLYCNSVLDIILG